MKQEERNGREGRDGKGVGKRSGELARVTARSTGMRKEGGREGGEKRAFPFIHIHSISLLKPPDPRFVFGTDERRTATLSGSSKVGEL